MISSSEQHNFELLRDCVSSPIMQSSALAAAAAASSTSVRKVKKAPPGHPRRRRRLPLESRNDEGVDEPRLVSPSNAEAEEGAAVAEDDLGEFIDYLSEELFLSLPPPLRSLSYETYVSTPALRATYALPLPGSTAASLLGQMSASMADSLLAYRLLPSLEHVPLFVTAVVEKYVGAAIVAPAPISTASMTTRPEACELCARDWIPLTYHHLIPRSVHDKVRKRGWHPDWRLNAVAWLCRACHDFVHHMADNEELARQWWSIERIREREDIRAWVKWAGKVRWKKR
ncbi:MAG: hypothetical protein M1826_003354 [Phylliscum demangeonii]|nr:MAG: hypothetical protein M1826_003354 [Phylliscum demangeonii]